MAFPQWPYQGRIMRTWNTGGALGDVSVTEVFVSEIPKQLPREKLTEIMSLKWITNYEKAFQNITSMVAADTKFTKLADGSIQTTYE
ncbi:hypothetical protein Ddye_019240 [Dipteronia dyeriana]|uniref:Uncharacterized protein n=1 Tax=Dipteronia dyeriana TaxID=168575 RepID=A0AAD9TXH7_9ROSI|nr:hypothetical protein Ddye_019240 [Dipteronia dyeriana]